MAGFEANFTDDLEQADFEFLGHFFAKAARLSQAHGAIKLAHIVCNLQLHLRALGVWIVRCSPSGDREPVAASVLGEARTVLLLPEEVLVHLSTTKELQSNVRLPRISSDRQEGKTLPIEEGLYTIRRCGFSAKGESIFLVILQTKNNDICDNDTVLDIFSSIIRRTLSMKCSDL